MRSLQVGAAGTDVAMDFVPETHPQYQWRNKSLSFDSPAVGTLKFYRATEKTLANADVSDAVTLVVDTDASGYVNGAVLTDDDYVLIVSSAGSTKGVYQMRKISVVAAVSDSTVSLTLASAVDVSEDDVVYIVRDAEIESITTGVEVVKGLRDQAASAAGFPVAVELAATGACSFTSVWEESNTVRNAS